MLDESHACKTSRFTLVPVFQHGASFMNVDRREKVESYCLILFVIFTLNNDITLATRKWLETLVTYPL